MRKTFFIAALGAAALAAATTSAASFTSDFSNPNQTGFTLNGGVRTDGVTPYPAIENGHLALTYAENSEQGTIVLDDLDGGAAIESFTARFKLQIGPGSGNPADGTAFSFGPDVTSSSNFSEEGTGNGIIVSFDVYDNAGGEAPAVDVKYGGTTLASTKFAKADMVTTTFVDVEIVLTRSGMLNVSYKGQALYTNLRLPDFAPVAGQFAIGARTGGENANQWVDDLSITTKLAGTAVGPTVTAQPQSVTANVTEPVTFSIGFDGSAPLSFQWLSNNVAIGGANDPTYTIARAPYSANGAKYKCTVSNTAGSVTSNEAILTVNTDTVAPTLVLARGSATFDTVTVTFSEPVDPAMAQQTSSYQFSGGLTISSATLGTIPNDDQVVLKTSKQAEDTQFTLTVNNVKDLAGNTIAADSKIQLRSFVFLTGTVLHKKYDAVDDTTGGNPDNLFADSRYPNAPDRKDLEPMWEYPPAGAGRAAADPTRNYFDTLEGFFIPPTTGSYVFFIAGADRWWLYLSTDDSPANMVMIAAEPGGWTDPRAWNTTHDTDPLRHRTDQSSFNVWSTAPTISLTGGKRYYMLEVHHDPSWCGADDFSATYIKAGETDPVDGSAPTLAGSVVGAYIDPTGSSIDITKQPADTTQDAGKSAVFTMTATGTSAYGGSVTYQWQKAAPGSSTFTDIAGATTASYTTPVLLLADSGAKYQVVCSVPPVSVTSVAAALTVVADTTPPKVAGATAIASQTGTTFDVGVSFDEVVDPVSAGTQANYALSAGSISAIKYYAGSHGVVLTASGLTVGNTYTVTVTGVKDISGNVMAATPKQFKVSAMKWGVVGADELALGNGVLATAENGFDVYSDGIGEWGTYDESTFVYEQVTGDFDKVLRVEYQDSSSQWARAGLVVRDVTSFGVNRDTQATDAGRYQKVHVNPQTTAMGTAGNYSWEGNRRLATGAATTSAGGGGTPLYPNAWCRLKRVGDLFTIFRSDDGVTWTQLGTSTFNEPMPANLFVGPEFSPENGNISPADLQGMWLAKFRDYGNYNPVVTPTIGISSAGVITYTGVLRSSATVNGTYAPVAGATSPYTVPKTGTAMFYRTASQ